MPPPCSARTNTYGGPRVTERQASSPRTSGAVRSGISTSSRGNYPTACSVEGVPNRGGSARTPGATQRRARETQGLNGSLVVSVWAAVPLARMRPSGFVRACQSSEDGERARTGISGGRSAATLAASTDHLPRITTSSGGHGGPSRRALRSSRPVRSPSGSWSPGSQRHAATIARTRS
jgi:hypothetical protein